MRNDRFRKTSNSLRMPAWARAFSLSELLIVVLIIVVVLAVAVPSFTTIAKDIELKQARSDIFAALSAARSRAIRDRQMVALHIFRDGPAYAASRNDPDPANVGYNQSNSIRWAFDRAAGLGIPHVPTNKLTMRLEVVRQTEATNNGVEFVWPGDHEPIVLPDSLGVGNPNTQIAAVVSLANEGGFGGAVKYLEDFYIVFGDDGKVMTVLVDYNLNRTDNTVPATGSYSSPGVEEVVSGNGPGTSKTWSASGLCMYDAQKFVNPGVSQYTYVNRPDNTITISPYTGLPMSSEATK